VGESFAPRLRHAGSPTGITPDPQRAPYAGLVLRPCPLAAALALALALGLFAGLPRHGPAAAPGAGTVIAHEPPGGTPLTATSAGVDRPDGPEGPETPPPTADTVQHGAEKTGAAQSAVPDPSRSAAPSLPQKDRARAKYQTNEPATLYASATSKKKRASIPADYTLASPTNKISSDGTRVQVRYRSKIGWVLLSQTTKVAQSTMVGKLSWKASAAKNVAKWCAGVSIRTNIVGDNSAHVDWTRNGPERKKASEWINLATVTGRNRALDPNHPMAVAVQYHECAHILQYRAYGYDGEELKASMDRAYGKGNGVEHMADCMADAMGAKRTGTEYLANGSSRMWVAGYGGSCTGAQLAAARKLIAGERP